MSTQSVIGAERDAPGLAAAAPAARPSLDPGLLYAAAGWLAAGTITLFWPNTKEFAHTSDFGVGQWLFAALLVVGYLFSGRLGAVSRWLANNALRLLALAALLTIWQLASAKLGYWPQPYFPPPQGVLDAYVKDYPRLLDSIRASLVLLVAGVALGSFAGFLTGLSTGWSPKVGYWTIPVLRLFGPVPATSLIPIVVFVFPSSFSGGIFLVALAAWFPVAILTWSGVSSVDNSYYDVARTLGARQRFLLLKIAVPASLPHLFVGLFMALGSAISVLVVAEMMGVKAGLGYYLDWAQGWAAYGHLYGALIIMSVLFSSLITLLFRVRDRVLVGRKGEVQW
ncbi:ABC transporter permease [Bosea sp. Root381]|uniref:ABC transporter permease n=1 Tax=Bosea sp. Root381 TaxID=1736524 RepID=UPI0006FC632F|nr:ABC transporter permease subunit [Bosea sp. Root381]KRE06897.1 ABC transporter permease [Bosea sp. Root381]